MVATNPRFPPPANPHRASKPVPDLDCFEEAVREFHNRVSEMERVAAVMCDVLSMEPESDFYSAVWALVGGYQGALGAAYGIDGWLEWWWLECKLGENPMQAAPAGGELRTIATVDDLVKVICEDVAAGGLAAVDRSVLSERENA